MSRREDRGAAVRARVRRRTRRVSPLPEWLAQAASAAPRALLCGGRVVVEGCGAVAVFSPNAIALETGGGPMRIEGEGLEIERLQENSVMVRGRICALFLEDGHARA